MKRLYAPVALEVKKVIIEKPLSDSRTLDQITGARSQFATVSLAFLANLAASTNSSSVNSDTISAKNKYREIMAEISDDQSNNRCCNSKLEKHNLNDMASYCCRYIRNFCNDLLWHDLIIAHEARYS